MFAWLKDHSYLATWLGPIVAMIVAIIQNRRKGFAEVDWSRLLIYFLFLTSIAVTFTPSFDQSTRKVAEGFVFALLGFLIVDRKQRD
jgi:hypothetical protein